MEQLQVRLEQLNPALLAVMLAATILVVGATVPSRACRRSSTSSSGVIAVTEHQTTVK